MIDEGEIPLQEWIDAIQSTGYDGFYSREFLNDQLWEGDHYDTAEKMLAGMNANLTNGVLAQFFACVF